MAVNFTGVDVPQQLVKLDCVQVTTAFGSVLREVVAIADPEFPNQLMRVNADGAVAITTTTPIDITATTLPLPAGAASEVTLSAANTKLDALDGVTNKDIGTQITTSDVGIVTNTVIHGLTTGGGGGYVDVKVTPSGAIVTDTGFDQPLTETQLRAAPMVTTSPASSFTRMATNGTMAAVKSGAGKLRRVVINTKGSTANLLTIYDSLTAVGTIIGIIDTTVSNGSIEYDLNFTNGLTLVLVGGLAADITVIFE